MKSKYSRVFIGNSAYALFNYLLVSTKEEIEDTFFFFSDGIPTTCADYFGNRAVVLLSKRNKLLDELYCVLVRFFGKYRWSCLKNAQIYSMVDGPLAVELIGDRKISVIEEGAEYLDIVRPKRRFRRLRRVLHGHFYNHIDYEDERIQALYLTGQDRNAPVMKLSKIIQFNHFEEWKHDENRRKMIMECFGLTLEDISNLSSCETMLLSQTFAEDGIMGLDEEIELYKTLLEGVDIRTLCIKPHPREKLKKYNIIFPGAFLFTKKVPFQLIMLCVDLKKFKAVYTISSTAARALKQFCPDLKIVFGGSEVHPSIVKRYGYVKL